MKEVGGDKQEDKIGGRKMDKKENNKNNIAKRKKEKQ